MSLMVETSEDLESSNGPGNPAMTCDGLEYETELANDMDREVDAGERCSWREVDRNLRAIAQSQAELDAREAPWLRLAEELKIWRPLGMVSALDYMERVLGYEPRTAQERLRVARALGDLPLLGEALNRGTFRYSSIRALTRVATRKTEQAWHDRTVGKTVKEVYDLTAGRAPGSLPDDPVDPRLEKRIERFELDPATYALLRQARQVLSEERGAHLESNEVMAALCEAVLDGSPSADSDGRAKFQIALTVCERCDQGWQDGAGAVIAVDAATVDRARCDPEHIGSLEAGSPARSYQDVTPAVSRFVWRRDHGRCQTPGCRSTRGIEIHHIVGRADGGSHDPSNLTLRCGGCHRAVHHGLLTITGTASDQILVHRVAERKAYAPTPATEPAASESKPPVREPSKLETATVRAQVRDAMVNLGWKPAIVRAAIETACLHVGSEVTFDRLIRESLRCCRTAA